VVICLEKTAWTNKRAAATFSWSRQVLLVKLKGEHTHSPAERARKKKKSLIGMDNQLASTWKTFGKLLP